MFISIINHAFVIVNRRSAVCDTYLIFNVIRDIFIKHPLDIIYTVRCLPNVLSFKSTEPYTSFKILWIKDRLQYHPGTPWKFRETKHTLWRNVV